MAESGLKNPFPLDNVLTRAAGKSAVSGHGSGTAVVLDAPLSFSTWGHVDPKTGLIIDENHPQRGISIAGKVLVLPSGLALSTSPAVLLEMVRHRTNPTAIVLASEDSMMVLGAVIAQELYGVTVPIVVLDNDDALSRISGGSQVVIHEDGTIEFASKGRRG